MGYVILTYPAGRACEAFDEMVAELQADGAWTLAHRAFRLAVLTDGDMAPRVTPIAGHGGVAGVLIGRAFDRAATERGEVAAARLDGLDQGDPIDACRRLVFESWGGYVALWIGRPKDGPTILRDPSGAMEVLAWRRDDVTVVSSHALTGRAGPLGLAIDWARVQRTLDDPTSAAMAPPPLTGLLQVEPGSVLHGPDLAEKTVLWSPAAVVRTAQGRNARRRGWPSRQEMRQTIDACVRALAADEPAILCEISGGLDSAIIATSLAASGLGPHAAVNFYRDQPEADERVYAQAVADRAGVALRTVRRPPFTVTQAVLQAGAISARPNFNGLDPGYDEGIIVALDASDAKVLFTGQGGDTVFFQIAASALASDLLRGTPCEGSRLRRLEEVARRTRRSLWSLAGEAITGRPSRNSLDGQVLVAEAARQRRSGPSHPWLTNLKGVSVAKRQQIAALAANLIANGETGRARRARIVHPLLCQPVVEMGLAIPAPVLSAGEGERSFAREAFGDRLPSIITQRRSKGDVSVFMGRTLAASAGFFRDFLLDGRLAAQGLIDPAWFAAALEPEAMVWKDASREILAAATLEAWVRYWEGRLSTAAPGVRAGAIAVSGPDVDRKASARKAKAR